MVVWIVRKNVYLLKKQVLIILFRGRFSLASDLTRKKRRPRRRELSLAQLVALARYTRELLPQPLWSCMKKFQTLINCPKIKFSDHKAAAGAVRRRRKRLVAAGGERHGVTQARSKPKGLATKPASAWSAFFSKGVQSRKKTSIIYPLDYYFYNTFNPLENIYSYCIRNKHTYQTSQKTEQSTPK